MVGLLNLAGWATVVIEPTYCKWKRHHSDMTVSHLAQLRELQDAHGLRQRRACIVSGIARSTLRYRAVPRDDSRVIIFIEARLALNPRHGFGLLYDSARHQGQPWGKSMLGRVHGQFKLNLPGRGKKRLPERSKQPLQAAGQPNQG